MHADKRQRMHDLVMSAMTRGQLWPTGLRRSIPSAHALKPLVDFIKREYSEWIQESYAQEYVWAALDWIISKSSYFANGQAQGPNPPYSQWADEFCDYWSAFPYTYTFIFPLPGAGLFDANTQMAPGFLMTTAAAEELDSEFMRLDDLATSLSISINRWPCLKVEAKGLMRVGAVDEIPARSAAQFAKAFLLLGLNQGLLTPFLGPYEMVSPPRFARYTSNIPLPDGGTARVPDALANVLRQVGVPGEFRPFAAQAAPPTAEWIASMQGLGDVIHRARNFKTLKDSSLKGLELDKYYIDQQCARIAWAAEWAADSLKEFGLPTAVIQVAIALEALYGGTEDDPVVKTLTNRIAYTLSETPQARKYITNFFEVFYKMRSKFVHGETTGVTADHKKQLQKAAQLMRSALSHELAMVKRASEKFKRDQQAATATNNRPIANVRARNELRPQDTA